MVFTMSSSCGFLLGRSKSNRNDIKLCICEGSVDRGLDGISFPRRRIRLSIPESLVVGDDVPDAFCVEVADADDSSATGASLTSTTSFHFGVGRIFVNSFCNFRTVCLHFFLLWTEYKTITIVRSVPMSVHLCDILCQVDHNQLQRKISDCNLQRKGD